MLKIIDLCQSLSCKLDELEGVADHRVVLKKDQEIYCYVVIRDDSPELPAIEDSIRSAIVAIAPKADTTIITQKEKDADPYYCKLFSTDNKLSFEKGINKYGSFLYSDGREPCCPQGLPVVTFYSYKGGVGRTTTLASFAMYLALNKSKKVVILDFDFEAPGLTNFFLNNPAEENQRQGIVEYLVDKTSELATPDDLEKYTWEVGNEYSGKGSIRVMPAGKLDYHLIDNDPFGSELSHYLHGLARLDFADKDYAKSLLAGLMADLNEKFNPDCVLVDSRTGFNDIMGISLFELGKFAVGLFRNDVQSRPGMFYFLQKTMKVQDYNLWLVDSLVPASPSAKKMAISQFRNTLALFPARSVENALKDIPIYPIARNEILEQIGTPDESLEDLTSLIKGGEFKDYDSLFGSIYNTIYPKQPICELGKTIRQSPVDEKDAVSMRKAILDGVCRQLDSINLYADDIDVESVYQEGRFFFRNCMSDLFNVDKPLVLGSKGTGKSFLYRSLKDEEMVERICHWLGKDNKYRFLTTIDRNAPDKKVNVDKAGIGELGTHKYRFWLTYTWYAIQYEITQYYPGFTLAEPLPKFTIRDDETTMRKLRELVDDDSFIIALENAYGCLNDYLKTCGGKSVVIVIYDQLDDIIPPAQWSEWIPELISIWRGKRFSRIYGKVFLRRDLFRRISNVNNIKDLENQAINIEWSKDEIYSYFFKTALKPDTASLFLKLMKSVGDIPSNYMLKIQKFLTDKNKEGQVVLDRYYLVQLVFSFFGKTVDAYGSNRMGNPYEWFFNNLKNADDTISLRPFIDLLKLAITKYDDENIKYDSKADNSTEPLPVLPSKYYTDADVRRNAVKRHFEDLCQTERDNRPISILFDYIKELPYEKRLMTWPKSQFAKMLDKAAKQSDIGVTSEDLTERLVANGIIREKFFYGDKEAVWQFAYLYKYFLGLKGS